MADQNNKKMSEAKKRANKKWNDANLKEKYDRINLVVPKGKKDIIAGYVPKGMSLNAFINQAIDCYIAEHPAGHDQDAAE